MADATRIAELFGASTRSAQDWQTTAERQICPFVGAKCFKVRKSQPDVSIGTCTVRFGRELTPLITCPNRFLADARQVFVDCLHLLTLHEPGNQLHVVPEVTVPGGSVDYFVVSVRDRKPVDFVGIELQALDTTGSVWPHRQEFLHSLGIPVVREAQRPMGVNWKMTSKTILVQLLHKIETFESLSKHLVLVMQTNLLGYLEREFDLTQLHDARLGDLMHFHAYHLEETAAGRFDLTLARRRSTDAAGISKALQLGQSERIGLDAILDRLGAKIGPATRWQPTR